MNNPGWDSQDIWEADYRRWKNKIKHIFEFQNVLQNFNVFHDVNNNFQMHGLNSNNMCAVVKFDIW